MLSCIKNFFFLNYIFFVFYFDQINSALMSRRYLKIINNCNVSKLLAGTLIIIPILYIIVLYYIIMIIKC